MSACVPTRTEDPSRKTSRTSKTTKPRKTQMFRKSRTSPRTGHSQQPQRQDPVGAPAGVPPADALVTSRFQRPHSPPPSTEHEPRRFRIAGADLSASLSVFLIALPLSLGIALATGAPLQAGLVAAAVGGIVAGRLGGSPLQVSGPAAGLTVVTADLIQQYGWRATCAVTVLAGLAQLGLAALRVARSALAVSPAVVHGMIAGIGVTIALAQLHIVLGGTPRVPPRTTSCPCPPSWPVSIRPRPPPAP